jgi:prepilin-type N-terminal cleavage/methylation domain-containing protein
MKLHKNAGGWNPRSAGMTLIEIMLAMTVFSLVIAGLIYLHLYGLRLDQLVQSKLGASDQSRRGFTTMCNDIRTAKGWAIGNGTATSFTPINAGTLQRGNALMLYPTTTTNFVINTNIFIVYHFNTTSGELLRRANNSALRTVAQDLTNNMFFQAENYRGDIQTTPTYRATIRTRLEFAQYQYPLTRVGAGYLYDYYKMEFCVTSHAPDGP